MHRPDSDAVFPAPSGKSASGTGRLDATLDRISLDPTHFLTLLIVLGVVAVAWAGCVATLLLSPPAPRPEAVAALPPLPVSVPPLAEVESNRYGQVAIGLGESRKPESAPVNPDVPHEASLEPVPPAASTRVRAHEKTPDISAHSVNLPEGKRLEAHPGHGDRLDEPRHADERDRETTPPRLYKPAPREAPLHGVQAMTITTGHRYSATVKLSGFEAFADNDRIASVLTSAGFAGVTVTGSGETRSATGTWTGATMTRAVDPHLSNVRDLSG